MNGGRSSALRPAARRPRQAGSVGSGEAGFTLIEVVATLAITGLLLAVVLPGLPRAVSRPQLDGVALAVAAILTSDHRAALRQRIAVFSTVDATHRLVRSGAGGDAMALPAGVAVGSALARTCLGSPVRDKIVFLPDGTSCGGSLTLDRDGQSVVVSVNWLTGATDIASRPR